jgi:hypothetical protein
MSSRCESCDDDREVEFRDPDVGTMPCLPDPDNEVVMDANGAYWRRYSDGTLSMTPTSSDNDPVVWPLAVFEFKGWEQPSNKGPAA